MSKLKKLSTFTTVNNLWKDLEGPDPTPPAPIPDPEETRRKARRKAARRYAGATTILSQDTLGSVGPQ